MKNDGRYTAYHVYQGLSFTEANRASTVPYRSSGMKCAHSQRGYLFQFDSMPERNHFDAANTSCCDEPVLNFANKPQYASAAKPMKSRDCRRTVKVQGCEILEASIPEMSAICASDQAAPTRVKIRCPKLCVDLAGLAAGESFSGRFGKFRCVGMEAGDVMILDYEPDRDMLDRIYASCAGPTGMVETFCDGYTLEFSVSAGLDYPSGCGCDCCGVRGIFPAPDMSILAPDIISAGWANSIGFAEPVNADPACKGADITATFNGVYGSSPVIWESGAQYVSDGVTRYITRKPSGAGSSANPTCCGGFMEWTASDGCGATKTKTTIVSPRVSGYSFSPEPDSTLMDGLIYEFRADGACSYSDTAGLNLSAVCLDNTQGNVIRSDGLMKTGFTRPLKLGPGDECSACCGAGSVRLNFANGCGLTAQASYSVRKGLSYGASWLVIGRQFRVGRYYLVEPFAQYIYDVQVASVYCDGKRSAFSRAYWGAYSTVSQCEAEINGPLANYTSSQSAVHGLADADTCLFYTDNGLTGLNLVSGLFSMRDRCCQKSWDNITWIRRSDSSLCCPA